MEGMEGKVMLKQRKVSGGDLGLRVLAFLLTLVAAIILGVDKQTKVVPLKLVPTLPPVDVPVSAKWQYLSAFVYVIHIFLSFINSYMLPLFSKFPCFGAN